MLPGQSSDPAWLPELRPASARRGGGAVPGVPSAACPRLRQPWSCPGAVGPPPAWRWPWWPLPSGEGCAGLAAPWATAGGSGQWPQARRQEAGGGLCR